MVMLGGNLLEATQNIGAGADFTGGVGLGRFTFTSGRGVEVKRITLVMGTEAKDYRIIIYDNISGYEFELSLDTASTESNILVASSGLVITPNEDIRVITNGATSTMYAKIIYREL